MGQPRHSSPVAFRAITSDYHVYPGQISIERFPGVATDGLRIFFPELQNGRVGLASVLVGGGDTHSFPLPPEILRPSIADISRDGADLLIRSLMWSQTEQPLWIVPSSGGSARKLFDVMAHDAAWTPDRSAILYASGQDLFLIGRSGGARRKLATLPGRAYWIRYSPDGSKVRFTLLDPKTRATSLWEIAPDGGAPASDSRIMDAAADRVLRDLDAGRPELRFSIGAQRPSERLVPRGSARPLRADARARPNHVGTARLHRTRSRAQGRPDFPDRRQQPSRAISLRLSLA